MELKPGYKLTEVGVIPEDWEVSAIGDIGSVSSGGTPSRANSSYWDGSIPWITTTQIDFNVITDAEQFITQDGLRNSAAKLFSPGTLLMAMYGQGKTRGKVAVLGIEAATNQACAAISLSKELEHSYIFHYLINQYESIRNLSNTGNQENLNGLIIRSIKIPIPPLPEQRSLATVLSDTDALIASLDRLIAKKRGLKQVTMQQLLTGKTRLPGFTGEWEVKKLGDLGTFLKGSGIKKDDTRSGNIPCIRYGEIYTHHNNYIKSFNSWISAEIAKTAIRLKQGDLLFAGSGETKEEIGKCVAFIDDFEAYAGGDIVIVRPFNSNSMFFGYYLNTSPINSQKASKGQGDAVVHISANALSNIEVKIPDAIEQTAIAQVLSDMDAEIAALEQRRDKTRALKQGMMQALLTGRIRLG